MTLLPSSITVYDGIQNNFFPHYLYEIVVVIWNDSLTAHKGYFVSRRDRD
jgi:hypothetical protein